jgi:hypothetical protein
VVDIEEKSCDFKGCEVAPGTYRLCGNIFDGFTGIKSNNLIFTLVKSFDQTFDSDWRKVPNRISLLIIKLRGCIEHELTERRDSFSSNFLVLITDHF